MALLCLLWACTTQGTATSGSATGTEDHAADTGSTTSFSDAGIEIPVTIAKEYFTPDSLLTHGSKNTDTGTFIVTGEAGAAESGDLIVIGNMDDTSQLVSQYAEDDGSFEIEVDWSYSYVQTASDDLTLGSTPFFISIGDPDPNYNLPNYAIYVSNLSSINEETDFAIDPLTQNIFFNTTDSSSQSQAGVINASGGEPFSLDITAQSVIDPQFSSNGKYLFYMDENNYIYRYDLDTGENITFNNRSATKRKFSICNDGFSAIQLDYFSAEDSEIGVAQGSIIYLNFSPNADEGKITLFHALNMRPIGAACSPDSSFAIATTEDPNGMKTIRYINLQNLNLNPQILTRSYQKTSRPVIQSDMSGFVFNREVDGFDQVFRYDLQRKTLRQMTGSPFNNHDPITTLDNRFIIYAKELSSGAQLFATPFDPAIEIQLTPGPQPIIKPKSSPSDNIVTFKFLDKNGAIQVGVLNIDLLLPQGFLDEASE